jgi:hypothetical protein
LIEKGFRIVRRKPTVGASLVLEGEKVIGATTCSAVVIMVIVTTLVTPPLLKWTLADRKASSGEGESEESREIRLEPADIPPWI